MASYDPDFQGVGPSKATPDYAAPPRRRGCLFYGCVTAVVLSLLLAVTLALGAWAAYRTILRYRDQYTATAPMPLPRLALSDEECRRAVDRIKAFRNAVEAGEDVPPLTLGGDDLNALIREFHWLKDRAHLEVVGDRIKAKVSLPLGEIHDLKLIRGRYLNGEAEIRLGLHDDDLSLVFDSLTVGGKPVPDEFREYLSEADIVLKDDDDDRNDSEEERRTKRFLRRLRSIEVADGVVTLTPRPPAASAAPGMPDDPFAPPAPPTPPAPVAPDAPPSL